MILSIEQNLKFEMRWKKLLKGDHVGPRLKSQTKLKGLEVKNREFSCLALRLLITYHQKSKTVGWLELKEHLQNISQQNTD